jgi:RHS repeat-associated protein
VAADWAASTIKWNNKPGIDHSYGIHCTTEGQWSGWDVKGYVQDIVNGAFTDYGLKIHANSLGQGGWKRIASSNDGSNLKPKLVVNWDQISATPATPINGAPGGRSLVWTYDDGDAVTGTPQTHYWVQVATSNTFGTIVAETPLVATTRFEAGATHGWTIPTGFSLTEGTTYWWRVKVKDGIGESAWSAGASFKFAPGSTMRGEQSFYTRVPFDLGGGWRMAVGVHNGELTLDRHLFEIPSYGPAQSLGLSYSSQNTTTDYFGTGWSSNLSQHLTFGSGVVYWQRADGGVVPFTLVGSTWTPAAGNFEALVHDSANSRYILTQKDQTKLFFQQAAPGRLTRIENRFGKALALNWGTTSATATDASGRVTNMVIASGRITSVTDSAGRTWSFGYTSNNLTTITDPAAKATTLAYGASGLTSVTRTRSRVSGSPETISWSIAYAGGKVSGVTDPVNSSAANTFTYTATTTTAGLLKTYSPVVRNNGTYTVDSLGRVTSALDPAGYSTSYTYDGNSNLTRLVLPISNSPVANQTIDFTYDARGNVLTQVEQLTDTTSVTTLMTYNATNDLLIRSESDNHSATKLITRHTYDGAGRLASVNVNCTSSGTTPPASASSCTGAGTLNSSTNLVTTFSYTANDQIETETDPTGRVIKDVYDIRGNRIETIANFVSGQSANHERNVSTSYAYNQATTAGKAGLVTAETDPLGNTVTFAYDVMGRQTSESLPGDTSIPALNRTTTYDELGNVLTSTDAWSGVSRTTSYVHDRANRETSVTDPALVEATTAYNAAGDAISSSSAGVTTTRTFDGLGRTLSETTAGATTSHAYDGQGRELEIVDPEGVRTVRAYDRAGRLTSETVDPAPGVNLVTSYTYDVLGREKTVTSPDGLTTTTSYDRPGKVVQSVSAGVTTTYTYDRAGNGLSTTVAGVVATTEYDPLNRPTVVIENDVATPTLPIHDVTTTTYYDAGGNTVAVTNPLGITTRSIINVRGVVAESIANCTDSGTTPTANPRACVGAGTHNSTTNVVSTTTYDGLGGALLTVVAQGTGAEATIHSAYDAAGRQQAVKDPRGTVSRYLYDNDGRLTETIVNCTNDTSNPAPPTGSWWTCNGSSLHDGTWNVTTSRTYDARGNEASETAQNGRVTTYIYDDADRLIQRIDNDVPGTPSSPDQDLSTFYAYDDAGRQSAVRSPTTNRTTFMVTRYFYDADGRLQKEIRNCTSSGTTPPGDPAWKTCTGAGTKNASTNLETVYGYDARGNRTSVTAADPSATTGTSTGTVTTRFAYDAENRLCRVLQNATVDLATLANPCSTSVSGTASQNVSTRYTYDALGNLASMIDGRGNHTHYAYDAGGRMVRISEPIANSDPNATAVANVSTTYAYDALGRRTGQSQRGSAGTPLVSWTYDGAGRILSRVAGGQTTSYSYDDNGNRLTATSGAGTITTTYDRLNRPMQVTISGDAGATSAYSYSLTSPSWTDPSGTYAATLDAFDRQISLTDPIHGSSPFTWTYRADGQLATVAAPNGNSTAFGYDAAGTMTSKNTTGTGGVSRAAYSFTYNRAGQILTEASTITNDPSNGTTSYAYDKLGRLASFTRGTTTSYGWQEVPNRSSVQVGANPVVTTTYSTANRPTTDSAGGSYGHDVEGRMTARPGQALEWDALGRLTAVRNSSNNALISAYSYDALDRLLTANRNGVDHLRFRYVGLTTQPAQIVNHADNTVIRSIANDWTGARLLDWTGSGANQRYYGTNAHHDVTWTASDTGAVSNTLRYDPWGTLTSSWGTSLPDFRFQGNWLDSQTNLTWIVTRWYAPTQGRFISEDSLLGRPEDPPSRHLYAYVHGDPLSAIDPDGRWRWSLRRDEISRGPNWSLWVGVGVSVGCLLVTGAVAAAACAGAGIAIALIGANWATGTDLVHLKVWSRTMPRRGLAVRFENRRGVEIVQIVKGLTTASVYWDPLPYMVREYRFAATNKERWSGCPRNEPSWNNRYCYDNGVHRHKSATSYSKDEWSRPRDVSNPGHRRSVSHRWPDYAPPRPGPRILQR